MSSHFQHWWWWHHEQVPPPSSITLWPKKAAQRQQPNNGAAGGPLGGGDGGAPAGGGGGGAGVLMATMSCGPALDGEPDGGGWSVDRVGVMPAFWALSSATRRLPSSRTRS